MSAPFARRCGDLVNAVSGGRARLPRPVRAAAALGRMAPIGLIVEALSMTAADLTVYHDGSCPVCRREIGTYRRSVGAERIEFVDVTDANVDLGPDLPREKAMGRFHVRLPSGELKSGAAAFVEIWRVLTFWRPVAMVARLPGAVPALELGYRLVSPFRPAAARLLRHFV